jgi:hypothetical protein
VRGFRLYRRDEKGKVKKDDHLMGCHAVLVDERAGAGQSSPTEFK